MMKIQCNVCETAEAKVLCVADEAALCWACDEKIHAANKLASKHQRVPLSTSSSHMPKCDICQEAVGYFFCLEDRALLCRKCDVAIHTANTFVAGHQRFLLTGVRVGLEPTEPGASTSSGKSISGEKMSETNSCPVSRREILMPLAGEHNETLQKSEASAYPLSRRETSIPLAGEYKSVLPVQAGGFQDFAPSKVSFTDGFMNGSNPQFWNIDEFVGINELNQNFDYMGYGSSKADSGKLGDSDSSGFKAAEEELDDDCLGLVPDSSWIVPQIPSPPTASGLYWSKNSYSSLDHTTFVPDIYDSRVQDAINCGNLAERRKKF